MATIVDVAQHLDVDSRSVSEMLSRGILPKAERGQHDLDVCRVAYLRHLRFVARKNGNPANAELAEERVKLTKAQVEAQELRNGLLSGELVRLADVQARLDESLIVVRSAMLRIPARAGATMAGLPAAEIRSRLDRMVRDALSALSTSPLERATDPEPDLDPDLGDPDPPPPRQSPAGKVSGIRLRRRSEREARP